MKDLTILRFKGGKQNLSLKEKHLLHIIENNYGIQTSDMAKKAGASTATVKRMLDRLII